MYNRIRTEEEKQASWNKMMDSIAATMRSQQVIKDGDYYNEDGLLICGVCGEPRQMFSDEFNGNIVPVQCRCETEADKEAEKQMREERHQKLVAKLKEESDIPKKYTDATFENFVRNKGNQWQYERCLEYAQKFTSMKEGRSIIMTGNIGTGKTYAAACIGNYLLEQEVSVAMANVIHVLDEFRDPEKTSSGLFAKLVSADLLILDDLGAEHATDYAIERLYSIVNERYVNDRPVIVCTNLTFDSMASCEDIRYARIYNRIMEGADLLSFTGRNWRMDIAYKNYSRNKK
ncbi:MAG: ATP-binding protein [Clostridia bacterium]|nr:ATP-binding protein [Clostridia bacterium]